MTSGPVDVVIPVFNGERYIERAIRSVQAQSVRVHRIIIADDGSTDGTAEIINDLKISDDRIVHLKRSNGGVSAARNAGIQASSSSLIAFLDADDIWLPNKLELQLAALAKGGGEVGFVHSSYFYIDENDNLLADIHVTSPKQRGDIFLPLLLEDYVLSGSASSVLVLRDVLDKAGTFDEQLFFGEDADLWIRLARISKVDFTPESVVGIRIHDQSAQRLARPGRAFQFFQQQMLIYSKWEDVIAGDRRFRIALRRRAIDAVLPLWRTPSETIGFYRSLASSDSALARSLFYNGLDFYFALSLRVVVIFWRRITRKVGLNAD